LVVPAAAPSMPPSADAIARARAGVRKGVDRDETKEGEDGQRGVRPAWRVEKRGDAWAGGRGGRGGGAGTVGTRDTSLPDCWQLPAENNIPYTKTVGGRPASILSDHNPRHKAISTL
jgi:hypothetical protein